MKIQPTTTQQEEIIYLIYQYRYLLVSQLMKILNHKDPRRIHEWLNDLVGKKYIAKIEDKDLAPGYIYCLDTKARYILKDQDNVDPTFLGRLYKEKKKEGPHILRNNYLAKIFLYFLAHKEKGQEISFFTNQELSALTHFPDPRPSAYIEVTEGKETERYFLEYFDEYSIHKAVRARVQYYLDYLKSGDWQAETDEPFPSIFFVLPTEKFKNHIKFYATAVFEKNLGDDIDLFLTTKQQINKGQVNWERIKV